MRFYSEESSKNNRFLSKFFMGEVRTIISAFFIKKLWSYISGYRWQLFAFNLGSRTNFLRSTEIDKISDCDFWLRYFLTQHFIKLFDLHKHWVDHPARVIHNNQNHCSRCKLHQNDPFDALTLEPSNIDRWNFMI